MATNPARRTAPTAQTAEQKAAAAQVNVYLVCSPFRWGKAPDDVLFQVDDEIELTVAEAATLPPGHVKVKPPG